MYEMVTEGWLWRPECVNAAHRLKGSAGLEVEDVNKEVRASIKKSAYRGQYLDFECKGGNDLLSAW